MCARTSAGVIRVAALPSLLAVITLASACSAKHATVGADAGTDGGNATGVTLSVAGGLLRIEVCAADVIRVAYAGDASFFTRTTAATAPKRCDATAFTQTSSNGQTTITTARLTVRVDESTGAVTFLDLSGAVVLAETSDGRAVTPATVQGEATNNVRQQWAPNDGESLYGLGQHQHGLIDIKDTDLDLHQYNTEVFIPFLVSSDGYGLLWDNTSRTRFGDLTPAVPLPVADSSLYATGGEVGDVAPGSGTVDWTGPVTAPATGDYTFRTYSSGTIQLSIDDQLVIDHWRQGWQPNEDLAHVTLSAGQTAMVHLHWSLDPDFPLTRIVRLLWKPPVANRTTSLWSEVGDGVDYWFVYGPELDQVVAGYRRVTGQAPMMPRWAYGFWQSRDHYQSAQDLTDVLTGYRSRSAPIDNIVQDWQYWPTGTWGSHEFDPARYPDPIGLIQSIHADYHAHLMISVWPKFYPPNAIAGSTFSADNYVALNAIGAVFQPNIVEGKKDFLGYPFTFYDAFNPAARQLYWSQINDALFSKGIDAWWMDATEPEIVEGPFTSGDVEVETNQTHMTPTAAGSGARVLNAFSLMNSQAIYEGQRAAVPNAQRVFILTRNGFAGQQRYAATTWSGDASATWTAMRKQIPAGLSFSLSGIPYWTLDSGGYAVPPFTVTAPTAANPDAADEWYEMNTRWFEYATFLPIMRVHGQAPPREIWQFGGDTGPAYAAMLKFDRLRYRLLPYIYSLAGGVTQHAGTILRALVMDFRGDATARAIGDQYMFGPALMVSPVSTYQARTRSVYLPPSQGSGGWYDFWTGAFQSGAGAGQTIDAAADFDAMPVFVRAGSILPLGPDLQYTDEKAPDPITLYVYAGADGAFTLYEDDGTSYSYESGTFATIAITWNDAARQLTIGARSGSFTGMLGERRFEVVVVDPTNPVGYAEAPPVDQEIVYTGDATSATF